MIREDEATERYMPVWRPRPAAPPLPDLGDVATGRASIRPRVELTERPRLVSTTAELVLAFATGGATGILITAATILVVWLLRVLN